MLPPCAVRADIRNVADRQSIAPRLNSTTPLSPSSAATAAQPFPAIQTFFPKFRATTARSCVQSSTFARVSHTRDNGCTCTAAAAAAAAASSFADTHMFAVASRDVCPFTYPRAPLSPFLSRAAQQQTTNLSAARAALAENQRPNFTSSSLSLSGLFLSFSCLCVRDRSH